MGAQNNNESPVARDARVMSAYEKALAAAKATSKEAHKARPIGKRSPEVDALSEGEFGKFLTYENVGKVGEFISGKSRGLSGPEKGLSL